MSSAKNVKCPFCRGRFKYWFDRAMHLHLVHGWKRPRGYGVDQVMEWAVAQPFKPYERKAGAR